MVKGDAATLLWYDFPNVFKFFAGFGRDGSGFVCVCVHLYVLQHGARDLVDGINGPGRNPDITRPADQFRRAFLLSNEH